MTIIPSDIRLIYSFLTAKCIDLSLIIDYSTSFKDISNTTIVNSVQCVLNRGFLTIEVSQIQFILVSASAE